MEGKKSEHRQGKQMLLCRCSWLFYHLRDNEWWRRNATFQYHTEEDMDRLAITDAAHVMGGKAIERF